MAKVIIEFDSVEEADEIRSALDGYKWQLAMWDLDQHLRNELKHNDKLTSELDDAYDKLRSKIREILSNYSLTIE